MEWKFGNFTSCSENGNEIARGAAECYFTVIATTLKSKSKSKYLIFKLASTMSSGFLLLLASHDGSGLTFFVHRAKADSLPS